MLIFVSAVFLLFLFLFFEYRIRKPDQIILYEAKGKVKQRKIRYYPRHFSLAISGTIYSSILDFDVEAKGKIPAKIRLAISAAPAVDHLHHLIRTGSWKANAIEKAVVELEIVLQSIVKEYAGQYEVEELSSEKLSAFLQTKLGDMAELLGLDIVNLNVQAIDPADKEIVEAMQKREAARILEQTEAANQNARVAAARAKIKADEKIAFSEHELALKKYNFKKIEDEKESRINNFRIEEKLKHRKMELEVEREEMALLQKNPEMLLLTPQVARLAEASQNLPNAKTVISLSNAENAQNSQFLVMLYEMLQNIFQSTKTRNG